MEVDFKDVLKKSPNPYVLMDRDLTIVWANDAYLQVTGRGNGEIVGRNLFDAFPSEGESYRKLHSSLKQVVETGEPHEIAHIRYDIPASDGGFDTHVWSATHTPLANEDGQVTHVLQHTVDISEVEERRRARDASGVLERARSVEERYAGATRELERFRALFEQAPGFVAVLSGKDHRFLMANAAYRHLIGDRELIGKSVAEALPEVVEQGFVSILDKVYSTGEPYLGRREEVRLHSGFNDELIDRRLEFIFQPIMSPSGRVQGVVIQGHDVTEEFEAQEHQRLLINELNHRVKNTLAVVQGLAQQSFRQIKDEAPMQVFGSRLAALAGAHNLLTRGNWKSAEIRTVIDSALEATVSDKGSRISREGPKLVLPPQPAVALAMLLHELATNALKYGAFSTDKGSVDIAWKVVKTGEDRTIHFDWREKGGPQVKEPEYRGFGSRLILRGFGAVAGTSEMNFEPEGLHCHIEARL